MWHEFPVGDVKIKLKICKDGEFVLPNFLGMHIQLIVNGLQR